MRPFREALFWTCAAALAAGIVAMDRAVLFVYVPRWALALPTFLFLFPSRVDATYWARAAACILLVALPFALAPVRWNLLKSFYVDSLALDQGMTFADALNRMSAYHPRAPNGDPGAHVSGVGDPAAERQQRLVIVPSDHYGADWCILHREGEILARVEISPD